MKKKLKEYILKNYEDGDYYWKIYGEDKDCYKVSAIDRIGLDDHHFKGRGVYGVWEKIPVDLEYVRPFSPVNPFSKTLQISRSQMPTPLSTIFSTILFLFTTQSKFILGFSFFEYFIELTTI